MFPTLEPVLFRALLSALRRTITLFGLSLAGLLSTSGWFVQVVFHRAGIDPTAPRTRTPAEVVSFEPVTTATRVWKVRVSQRDTAEIQRRQDTGTVIGKIENVLVLVLVLLGAYTALSVVFAGKSIVRKDDMGRGDTSYYLTGTIANVAFSFLWSLSTSVALRVWVL